MIVECLSLHTDRQTFERDKNGLVDFAWIMIEIFAKLRYNLSGILQEAG